MRVTIRDARRGDATVVADYNRQMALETEGKQLDEVILRQGVEAVLSDPSKGRYFLAEAEGRVVGQMMITLEWSDWRNAWFWWIQSVYVHPDHRRQGVFSALFRHVQRAAMGSGQVCGLRLYAERENETAKATYQRLGMRETHYDMFELEF